MDKKIIIEIKGATPRIDSLRFNHPVNWTIKENEHWAVIGPNGGGKTLLVDILLGKYALKEGEIISADESGANLSVSSVVKSRA